MATNAKSTLECKRMRQQTCVYLFFALIPPPRTHSHSITSTSNAYRKQNRKTHTEPRKKTQEQTTHTHTTLVMRLTLALALVASATAQVIVAPSYALPSSSVPLSTVIYSTPSSSSAPVISVLPYYPTGVSNGTAPLATGSAAPHYPVASGEPNGITIAPTVPTTFTDPNTAMDPAQYGGGAVGRGFSGVLLAVVAVGAVLL